VRYCVRVVKKGGIPPVRRYFPRRHAANQWAEGAKRWPDALYVVIEDLLSSFPEEREEKVA
jgi:hypothetical protein